MQIKQGDVVVLKSGGPRMTASHEGNDGWMCVWFSGDELKHGRFEPECLVLASEPRAQAA